MKFRHWSLIKLRDFYWKQPGWSKNKHTRVAYPEGLALLLLWHPYNESAYHHYEIPNVQLYGCHGGRQMGARGDDSWGAGVYSVE